MPSMLNGSDLGRVYSISKHKEVDRKGSHRRNEGRAQGGVTTGWPTTKEQKKRGRAMIKSAS